MPSERPGPCSAMGDGGVLEGSSPGVMVEAKIYAGVVSGRKGEQELVQCGGPCRGYHGRADLVDTIVRRRDASGAGWRGGWSSWRQIFMKMSP